MPTLLESVSQLTESAKKLRAIADELNKVEIKSEIVDQIILIQEIREEILTHGEDAGMLRAEPAPSSSGDGAKLKADAGFVHVEPPKESETYGFVAEPEPEPEPPPEPEPKPAPEGSEAKDGDAESTEDGAKESETIEKKPEEKAEDQVADEPENAAKEEPPAAEADERTPEERAAIAEMRISELEPLQQATLKRMNDILTPEQKKLKSARTKAGQKKGLSGKQLQQFVIASLELTEEQQHKMTVARKELHDIRVEIKKHVANMLTDEQRAEIAGKAE